MQFQGVGRGGGPTKRHEVELGRSPSAGAPGAPLGIVDVSWFAASGAPSQIWFVNDVRPPPRRVLLPTQEMGRDGLAMPLDRSLVPSLDSELPSESRARTASRRNGSLSRGPRTEEGKAVSSQNAIQHGFSAQCVLMSGESLEERRSAFGVWMETFRPATPGEAAIVAKIVDAISRQERLTRYETHALGVAVEVELKKTAAAHKIEALDAALHVAQDLAQTAGSVAMDVPFESVQQLAPAMRRSLELVEAADVPLQLIAPVRDAMNSVMVDTFFGSVPPTVFHALVAPLRGVEAWLSSSKSLQVEKLEEERLRLAEDPTLLDGGQLKKVERHQARLVREMEGLLRLLKQVRELARPGDHVPGSFVRIELRVVRSPARPTGR